MYLQNQNTVKNSRPNYHLRNITFKAYSNDDALCVISCTREYFQRTEVLCGEFTKFFISFVKPHRYVRIETISRWLKSTLELCNIDTTIFKAHSDRAAAASAVKQANVPIEEILNKAHWNNAKTF